MSVIVLIVDDDKAVRFFHRVMVSQSGLSDNPLSFNNGNEAFQYLTENYNNTDTYLLLLDINMPEMDGWQLMDALKDEIYRNQVYIIMVTSSVDKADHERAKMYSIVMDVVEKPISEEDCLRIKKMSAIAPYFEPG